MVDSGVELSSSVSVTIVTCSSRVVCLYPSGVSPPDVGPRDDVEKEGDILVVRIGIWIVVVAESALVAGFIVVVAGIFKVVVVSEVVPGLMIAVGGSA